MTATTLVLAERNIRRLLRNSGSLISATVIPGLFLVAIYVVFSEVMERGGVDYAQYLVPAATLQAILFTAGGSAMAIGVDKSTGLNDRLRTLPIPTASPILGRLAADLFRATLSIGIVTAIGLVLGFRLTGSGALVYLAGILGFAIAASLLFDGLAMWASSPEAAAGVLQIVTIPLVMLSTSYVPAVALPDGARQLIEALPVSVVGELLRQASTGGATAPTVWSAAAWTLGLLVVGGALSARAFRRRA